MALDEHELKARIEYARNIANYSKTELAERIGMTPSTFQRKMRNPLTMTLIEFYTLNQALNNEVLAEYLSEELNLKIVKRLHKRYRKEFKQHQEGVKEYERNRPSLDQ